MIFNSPPVDNLAISFFTGSFFKHIAFEEHRLTDRYSFLRAINSFSESSSTQFLYSLTYLIGITSV